MEKKLFYVALFGSLAVSSCSGNSPASKHEVAEDCVISAGVSFKKAQELLDSFKPEVMRGGENRLIDYPENYGGCYIGEDGKLNVYIATDFDKTRRDFQSVIGTDGVNYKKCLYSRNELMDLKRQVSEYVLQNKDAAISKNINHVAYSAEKNRVIVGLKDCSDAKVNAFKCSVVDSPAIEFVQANTEAVERSVAIDR